MNTAENYYMNVYPPSQREPLVGHEDVFKQNPFTLINLTPRERSRIISDTVKQKTTL